jgi:hypothetical protein
LSHRPETNAKKEGKEFVKFVDGLANVAAAFSQVSRQRVPATTEADFARLIKKTVFLNQLGEVL